MGVGCLPSALKLKGLWLPDDFCSSNKVSENRTPCVLGPLIHPHLTAAGAESGLATEGHAVLKPATETHIGGVTGFGIPTEHHPLHRVPHMGALVSRDFGFQPQITPAIPVVPKNLAKEVVPCRAIRTAREGEHDPGGACLSEGW